MKPRSSLAARQRAANFCFLAPALLLFVIFILLPFIQGIPVSLTNWNGVTVEHGEFVGLRNYINIFKQGDFNKAAGVTLLYTLITVTCTNVLGLLLALGVQRTGKLNNFLRSIYFMPFVISLILAAYTWRYLYSDIVNIAFGLHSPLGSMRYALPAVAGIAVWRDAGYAMVVYLAGLQMVPRDYYEAAEVEGAGAPTRFFKITLPLIMPSVSANVVLTLAWGLKQFDLVMAATGGGPGKATETLAVVIYKNIFEFMHAGYGQAAAIVFTVFVAAVSSAVSFLLRRREVEL
ncbi:carbohydrate ABC transporter permease [Harryflintia acetispora]|uniref:carbohydrate ABC transporter permease n=1 Tax=Harryflintia acetispora TaxID=1849041 RepID=UPI0018980268|nr:sugar ABC transporter permease [Harryflintia acetispora]